MRHIVTSWNTLCMNMFLMYERNIDVLTAVIFDLVRDSVINLRATKVV